MLSVGEVIVLVYDRCLSHLSGDISYNGKRFWSGIGLHFTGALMSDCNNVG